MRQKVIILSLLETAMAINAMQNKQSGPGGSARRLHHNSGCPEKHSLWGRVRIDACSKGKVFARHSTTVIGLF